MRVLYVRKYEEPRNCRMEANAWAETKKKNSPGHFVCNHENNGRGINKKPDGPYKTSCFRLRWVIMSWTVSMVILSKFVSVALV